MTTILAPSLAPPTTIAPAGTAEIADALNRMLADCFALYVKTKNFHWHASGPHFRDYHLLFDEQASAIFAMTDAIAERVRKIGAVTLRSIGGIAALQTIADNDEDDVPPGTMLEILRRDNLALIAALRWAKTRADAADDNATSALIDEWTDQAERRVWFLFEAART